MERQFAVAQAPDHSLQSTVMRHCLRSQLLLHFVSLSLPLRRVELARSRVDTRLFCIIAVEYQQPLQEPHVVRADRGRELQRRHIDRVLLL